MSAIDSAHREWAGQFFRTFTPTTSKGGISADPSKTAVLCIEYQNEFMFSEIQDADADMTDAKV